MNRMDDDDENRIDDSNKKGIDDNDKNGMDNENEIMIRMKWMKGIKKRKE
jgi:hypothetical protein